MASQFKNRLVGVTILVASVVIFLPSIIDGKKMAYEDEVIATPIRPEMKAHKMAYQHKDANKAVPISEKVHVSLADELPDGSKQTANENQQEDSEEDQWEVEEIAQTTTLSSSDASKDAEVSASPKEVKETKPVASPKVTKETKPVVSPKVAKETKAVVSPKVVKETKPLASSKVVNATKRETQSAPIQKKSAAARYENAWTIQLGAFQNAANINLLLKKLHKAGFQAHTIPSEVIDGELTRVFVGPNVSKTALESQLPQLKHLTQLQGKIMPFNAANP